MRFYEVLDQAVTLLRRLEDLKDELVNAQQLAIDEHGAVLVSPLRTTPQFPASR